MSLFAQCDYFRESVAVKKSISRNLDPEIAELVGLLDYNPETGSLTWKHIEPERLGNAEDYDSYCIEYVGRSADTVEHEQGYKMIPFHGVNHFAHKIAYACIEGKPIPKGNVFDHKDGNPANNSWNNLRLTTQESNMRNKKKSKNNSSGFTGVTLHKQSGKYHATLGSKYLGRAATAEAANDIRMAHIAANPQLGYTERHGQ